MGAAGRQVTRIGTLLHGGEVGQADLDRVADKLYFDRGDGRGRDAYVRFGVLLVLSVIIATGGVLADSTATVIGAMIVAPLMTPIMATALAVTTGDGRQMSRSMATVVVGIGVAVGLSYVMTELTPGLVDTASNGQITGRISPSLTDLIVALATGAVGAFAVSRENVADALPGVAIAISLVPPLAVVGVCLASSEFDPAFGAFLLFSTNVVSILLAGGVVFAVLGYAGVAFEDADRLARRRGAMAVAVGVIIVVAPLAGTSVKVAHDSLLLHRAHDEADAWVRGSRYRVAEVSAESRNVSVIIAGSGRPPAVEDLLTAIEERAGDIDLTVRIVPAEEISLDD